MTKKFLLAAALAVLTVTAAQSADIAARPYTKATVVDPSYNWAGFYIGANAGYGWAQNDHADLIPGGGWWSFGPGGPFGGKQTIKPTGAVYGGQVGYNWQASNWVFGLEGQFDGASISRTDTNFIVIGNNPVLSAKIDMTATATARLGYAFNNWLPYIKGGYAGAELKTSNSNSLGAHFDTSNWRSGYVVGAGLEYAFAPNWIAGVEYNYMDFGSKTSNGFTTTGVTVNSPESFSDKLALSTVTARLSYKFSAPVVAKY